MNLYPACPTKDGKAGGVHSILKRFVVAFVAFVGLVVPATFALALLAAPPARPESAQPPRCDRNLSDASASVAAMQARVKRLAATKGPEVCAATRLYLLELVKARAVAALCKNGSDRAQTWPL